MARISSLSSPFLLGFDQLESLLDSVSRHSTDGYPPYNIEHIDACNLRIVLALAGFTPEDLEITLEGNQLVIRGKQSSDDERAYLHRGIAARQFTKKFVLADGMDVTRAHLDNGLLNIDLSRPEPEDIVKSIKITTGKS